MRGLSLAATVKTAALLAVLQALPGSAYAQIPDTGAVAATNVSAELAQKVDSKNAKVGDDVVARTTAAAQLANGTKLPKGTRLMGKVTEVQAKTGAQHDGHLAFMFDHAAVKDGPDIPIRAALTSISAPVFAASGAPDDHIAGGLGGAMTTGGAQVTSGGSGSGGGPGLPGVTVSSSASGSSVLDAKGKNVELSGGTLMILKVFSLAH